MERRDCTVQANRKESIGHIEANSIGKYKEKIVLKREMHSTAAY